MKRSTDFFCTGREVVCAAPPPVGRAREIRRLIQGSSPEIWPETISDSEEVLAQKWGGLFWATSLEKIFGGVIAIISFRPGGWMQQSAAEVCYPFGREHGRHRAVKRREFITLLGGGAAAWPLAARAQQAGRMSKVGYLGTSSPSLEKPLVDAFRLRWEHPSNDCRKGRQYHGPHRLLRRSQSGVDGSRRKPQPTGRQRHRRDHLERRDRGEATGGAARVGPYGDHDRRARQPDQSRYCRDRNERPASSGPYVRPYAPYAACQQRTGNRHGLHDLGSSARRRACDRH